MGSGGAQVRTQVCAVTGGLGALHPSVTKHPSRAAARVILPPCSITCLVPSFPPRLHLPVTSSLGSSESSSPSSALPQHPPLSAHSVCVMDSGPCKGRGCGFFSSSLLAAVPGTGLPLTQRTFTEVHHVEQNTQTGCAACSVQIAAALALPKTRQNGVA